MSVPIVFRGPNGYAANTAAQHSQNFSSWYTSCPGLKVLSPYSADDAYGLLRTAIRDNDPVVFLEHELAYGMKFDSENIESQSDYSIPIGKAKIERSGDHLTLVTYSLEVKTCLEAAEELQAKHGIECEVINLRSLRPFDMDSIHESVAKTQHLVIVDGGWPQCSIASEISARIAESDSFFLLDGSIQRVTGADIPMPYSPNLEKIAIPEKDNIIQAALIALNIS